MSAFCVFGVSRTDCLRTAEKKVKRYDDEKKAQSHDGGVARPG